MYTIAYILTFAHKRNVNDLTMLDMEPGRLESDSIFIVQKHATLHMHYDFCMEIDGTLKSWAVPKGPSMNAKDKRFAVMIGNDSYRDFEENISQYNYGEEDVIIWDNGLCRPVNGDGREALKKGLKKGCLRFILDGKKLKGEFALIRIKGRERDWMLVKKNDKHVNDSNVQKKDTSIMFDTGVMDLGENRLLKALINIPKQFFYQLFL